jgi:hypothetical protein
MDSKSFHKPEGFNYCVCCYRDDNVHGVILMPGVNKIRGKDVFVYWTEYYYFFWFQNRKDAEEMDTAMKAESLDIEFKVELSNKDKVQSLTASWFINEDC